MLEVAEELLEKKIFIRNELSKKDRIFNIFTRESKFTAFTLNDRTGRSNQIMLTKIYSKTCFIKKY